MQAKHFALYACALALTLLTPDVTYAQGVSMDPDGAPSAWASLIDWFANLFGDAVPDQDSAG